MEEKNAEIPSTGHKVSRRDFLKLAFGAAVATPFALKGLEKAFYEALIFGIKNPDANDKAVSVALEVSENAPNSENPNYRPIVDILKEGISTYSKRSNKTPFFQRIRDYKGVDYYADVIQQSTSNLLAIQMPSEVIDKIVDSFSPEAREAFTQSSSLATGYELLFVPGSGFNERFRKSHPEFTYKNGEFLELSSERFTLMDQEGKFEIGNIKRWVEEKVTNDGKPISTSLILAHLLEKNEGLHSKLNRNTQVI